MTCDYEYIYQLDAADYVRIHGMCGILRPFNEIKKVCSGKYLFSYRFLCVLKQLF